MFKKKRGDKICRKYNMQTFLHTLKLVVSKQDFTGGLSIFTASLKGLWSNIVIGV